MMTSMGHNRKNDGPRFECVHCEKKFKTEEDLYFVLSSEEVSSNIGPIKIPIAICLCKECLKKSNEIMEVRNG